MPPAAPLASPSSPTLPPRRRRRRRIPLLGAAAAQAEPRRAPEEPPRVRSELGSAGMRTELGSRGAERRRHDNQPRGRRGGSGRRSSRCRAPAAGALGEKGNPSLLSMCKPFKSAPSLEGSAHVQCGNLKPPRKARFCPYLAVAEETLSGLAD